MSRKFKDSSVFLKWLISYLIVMLVPIIALVAVYLNAEAVVSNEIASMNSAMVGMARQSIDNKLTEAKKIALQVNSYPQVNKLKLESAYPDSEAWYDLGAFTDVLRFFTGANSFDDSLYILLHNSTIAVTPSGTTTYDLVYRKHHNVEGFSYSDWYEKINDKSEFKFIPALLNGTKPYNSIAYTTDLPMQFEGKFATLVALVDFEKGNFGKELFKYDPNILENSERQIYIIDENDNFVSPSGATEKPVALKYNLLNEDLTDIDDLAVTCISSQVVKLKYVVTLPKSVMLRKVMSMRIIMIFALALCIILGFLLSYVLSKKQYDPLKEIMSMVGRDDSHDNQDEFSAIKSSISGMISEKEKIMLSIEKYSNTLSQNFLANLLKGDFSKSEMESCNINFDSDKFSIVLINIDDMERVFDGKIKEIADQDEKLIFLVIKNVLEELLSKKHQGFVFEADGKRVCLVNFSDNLTSDEGSAIELEDILNEFKRFIEANFHVYLTISIGRIIKGISEIPDSYNSSTEMMQYRIINRKGDIISYRTIDVSNDKQYDFYSFSNETQLVNYIKIADFGKANEQIEQIFNEIIRIHPSASTAKYFLFYITDLLLKAISQMDVTDSVRKEWNIAERLLQCETMPDLKAKITEIFSEMDESILLMGTAQKEELKNVILKYVEDNYNDLNLNVNSVGYALDKNPAYISRFIKEKTGDSLLDYINKYRVKQAKKLLRDGKMSIADIAVNVGFGNNIGLIRAFKKYEGITPGDYRKIK